MSLLPTSVEEEMRRAVLLIFVLDVGCRRYESAHEGQHRELIHLSLFAFALRFKYLPYEKNSGFSNSELKRLYIHLNFKQD